MPLNVGSPQVEVLDDYRLRVTVSVAVTGFNRHESYSGAITVSSAPQSDSVDISGSVGTGAGAEHNVVLDAGLSEADFPTEVFITSALNNGNQNQSTVALELNGGGGGGGNGNGDERDGLTSREWAAVGAGAVGTGLALNRLLDD